MHSLAGTMSRVNTVTSLLKRFLSKDDSKNESRPGSAAQAEVGKIGQSSSSTSIAGNKYPANIGSMKITDQIIEEVDEQMTITSMRNKEEPRPTAQSIFAQMTPSDPVDVPGRVPPPTYQRYHSAVVHGGEDRTLFPPGGADSIFSSSAPVGKMPTSTHLPETMSEFDPKQYGSQETQKSLTAEELDSTARAPQADDDFEKLRIEREAARVAKQKEKMARSISTQQSMVNQIELQELLSEALTKKSSGGSTPTAEVRPSDGIFEQNL